MLTDSVVCVLHVQCRPLCTFGGTVAAFLVQWFGTGKHLDVDPDTGRITARDQGGGTINQGLLGGPAVTSSNAFKPTTGMRVRNLLGMDPPGPRPSMSMEPVAKVSGDAQKTLVSHSQSKQLPNATR